MFRSMRALALAGLLGWTVVACGGSDAPNEVAVMGSEYKFEGIPARIDSGLTRFTFQNTGREDHQFVLLQLNPGETLDSAFANPADTPEHVTGRGILYGVPGQTAERTIVNDLPKGMYGVVCYIQTGSEPPMFLKGMRATFEVV